MAGTGHPGVVIWRCEHRPDTHWGLVVITVVAQRAAAGISEDISSQYHGRDIQLPSPHCISLLSHTSQYNQTHQAFIWDPCLYRMHRDRTKSENTWTKIQCTNPNFMKYVITSFYSNIIISSVYSCWKWSWSKLWSEAGGCRSCANSGPGQSLYRSRDWFIDYPYLRICRPVLARRGNGNGSYYLFCIVFYHCWAFL